MKTFMARQPIFDRSHRIYGYELLFRDGSSNFCEQIDGDAASKSVINSFFSMGMRTVTGGKRAFINFTSNLLKNQIAVSLPREVVAIEILEDVEPDEEIINACKNLKEAGYLLVLDDFIFHPRYQPLIDLADIIKVDFCNTSFEDRIAILHNVGLSRIKFLAEKVETLEQYHEAFHLGYSYFQGYYFSQPVILTAKEIPRNKLNYLRLIQEINSPQISFEQIELVIKDDISLSYKLLRFLNSAHFGFRSKINSVRQALILLGSEEIRKWISLLTLKNLGADKPDQLVLSSIFRANFCEAIAEVIGYKATSNVFLVGMFSLIDVFLNRPLPEILDELPIEEDIKKTLLGEANPMRDIFELVVAYEKGNWDKFSYIAAKIGIAEEVIPHYYFQALNLAEEIASPEI